MRTLWVALGLAFLVPWYYWGVLPLTIGYAYPGAILAAGVTALGIWALPPRWRLRLVVQALLFIFLFKGWHSLFFAVFASPPVIGKALGAVEAVGMVVLLFFLGRWTVRVSPGRYALILVLSLAAAQLPSSWLHEVPHLNRVWATPPLQSKRTDNIPQVAFVPSGRGGMDLAVAAQAPWRRGKTVDPRTAPRVFETWSWQGGGFRSVTGHAAGIAAAVRPDFTYLPVARPHFRLYSAGVGYTLKQRLQPAAAAGLALNPGAWSGAFLDQAVGSAQAARGGWDRLQAKVGNLPTGSGAADLLPSWQGQPYGLSGVVLAHGALTGRYRGRSFRFPTRAQRIVGVGTLGPGGRPDLVLQGLDLTVVRLGAQPRLLFRVPSSARLPDVPRVQVQVARIGPGPQVLLVNDLETRAAVVGYAPGRGYRLLWRAPDHTFRFQAAGPFGQGSAPVVLALDKTPVPTLIKAPYLEALRWNGEGFTPLWHVYLPQVLFAKLAPLQGAHSQDLVFATLYGNAVGVFRPQTLPLEPATQGVTVLLVLGALAWRLSRRKGAVRHA